MSDQKSKEKKFQEVSRSDKIVVETVRRDDAKFNSFRFRLRTTALLEELSDDETDDEAENKMGSLIQKVSAGDELHECAYCSDLIQDSLVMVEDRYFHAQCFCCDHCQDPLAGKPYVDRQGIFFCPKDYLKKFTPKCSGCRIHIIEGAFLTAMNTKWHPKCFVCSECKQGFADMMYRVHALRPYCDSCYATNFGHKCGKCGLPIQKDKIRSLGKMWHADCFRCTVDDHVIDSNSIAAMFENQVYCEAHYLQVAQVLCSKCGNRIEEDVIRENDDAFHPHCLTCDCGRQATTITADNTFLCDDCVEKILAAAG